MKSRGNPSRRRGWSRPRAQSSAAIPGAASSPRRASRARTHRPRTISRKPRGWGLERSGQTILDMASCYTKAGMLIPVRSKGRIFLPKWVQERLGLREGAFLRLRWEESGRLVLEPLSPPGQLLLKPIPAKEAGPWIGSLDLGGDALLDSQTPFE